MTARVPDPAAVAMIDTHHRLQPVTAYPTPPPCAGWRPFRSAGKTGDRWRCVGCGRSRTGGRNYAENGAELPCWSCLFLDHLRICPYVDRIKAEAAK